MANLSVRRGRNEEIQNLPHAHEELNYILKHSNSAEWMPMILVIAFQYKCHAIVFRYPDVNDCIEWPSADRILTLGI